MTSSFSFVVDRWETPCGLFGGGNPTASATYQLAQKDTIIAKLEAERYADQQNNLVQIEISNLKQRLAAMEAVAPLREKIVGEQIGFVGATVNRLVQPMVSSPLVLWPNIPKRLAKILAAFSYQWDCVYSFLAAFVEDLGVNLSCNHAFMAE